MSHMKMLLLFLLSILSTTISAQEKIEYQGLWIEQISKDPSQNEYILIQQWFDDTFFIIHCSPTAHDNFNNDHVLDYVAIGYLQEDKSIRVDTKDTFFYLAFDSPPFLSHYHNGRESFTDRYYEKFECKDYNLEDIETLDEFHNLTNRLNNSP